MTEIKVCGFRDCQSSGISVGGKERLRLKEKAKIRKRKRDIIIKVFDPLLNLIVDFLFALWHSRELKKTGLFGFMYFLLYFVSGWPDRFGKLLAKINLA